MEEVKRMGRPPKIRPIDSERSMEEQKKGTKPGFQPANRQGTLKAKLGFTARWVRNDPANIARKRQEGWVIMKPEDNIGTYEDLSDVTDAKPLYNGIRYQDQIAMMLPDDLKSSREQYYREETRQTTEAMLRKTDTQFKQHGVATYTPKGQSGRIVIE